MTIKGVPEHEKIYFGKQSGMSLLNHMLSILLFAQLIFWLYLIKEIVVYRHRLILGVRNNEKVVKCLTSRGKNSKFSRKRICMHLCKPRRRTSGHNLSVD